MKYASYSFDLEFGIGVDRLLIGPATDKIRVIAASETGSIRIHKVSVGVTVDATDAVVPNNIPDYYSLFFNLVDSGGNLIPGDLTSSLTQTGTSYVNTAISRNIDFTISQFRPEYVFTGGSPLCKGIELYNSFVRLPESPTTAGDIKFRINFEYETDE